MAGTVQVSKPTVPRSRAVCANGEYVTAAAVGTALFRGILGIPEYATLTINIEGVTGDGDVGYVHSDLLSDGEVIDFGERVEEG